MEKGKNRRSDKYTVLLLCSLSFIAAFSLLFLLYLLKGFASFGELSLTPDDASYQFLDFFAYLKDVFDGKNSISYTFSKDLGGTGIVLFSYYLASPFNLLINFFNKEDLVSFFDLLVALKLGMAAFTTAYFLQKRFPEKFKATFILLLSLSYALMQYSIGKSCCIMWLDGVYMLPLMLLGVYYIVNHKKPWFLIFSTGAAILFNWYSAGINCLFTGIWFILEWLLALPDPVRISKDFFLNTFKAIRDYVAAMLCGILLSSVLFLPTIISLRSGGEGIFEWDIFRNELIGNIANVLVNFTLGSICERGIAALFCGSLVILGCIGFFLSGQRTLSSKLKVGTILLFAILIFYWQPLIAIFSLFKNVDGYYYRYSYVSIFLLVFIAANYYSEIKKEKQPAVSVIIYSLLFSVMLLVLSYIKNRTILPLVILSCIFAIAVAIAIAFYIKKADSSKNGTYFSAGILSVILVLELGCNASLLMDRYSKDSSSYHDYSLNQQEQIDAISEMDSGIYRITQTSTWNISSNYQLRANYDEALAYGYWSIASYTSDADNNQLEFLRKLGYRSEEIIPIVNQSVLAADSLLGVKYILSEYPFNGLELVESLGTYNKKQVYQNPYALPMAFVYDGNSENIEADEELNPFEYQNRLYSTLLGEDTIIYEPLDVTAGEQSDTSRIYILSIPDGNYAVYGNIPWDNYMMAKLNVNDSYETNYSRWTSPSVFYIPTDAGDTSANIIMTFENDEIQDKQFYGLNLDILKEAALKLQARAADMIDIRNGFARFDVTTEEGENLLVSIPYNKGWDIKINGEKISPETFADCLISLPLTKGKNIIEMRYHVPGLLTGCIISLLICLILIFCIFYQCDNRQSE